MFCPYVANDPKSLELCLLGEWTQIFSFFYTLCKRQSHEKVAEIRAWDFSLDPKNSYQFFLNFLIGTLIPTGVNFRSFDYA
jgi:hypothetical protein